MADNSTVVTWVVIIIVVIMVIALIWWYYAQQNPTVTQYETQNQTALQTQSSQKAITSFMFLGLNPPVNSVIDESLHGVILVVPKGTNVKTLSPTVVVSDYAMISPTSGTVQDFTTPVTYRVTAQDNSSQDYIVTVKVAP